MASESRTVLLAALAGNAVIAVTKFIASAVSGSSAMFAEGVHSVVDTGNQVLMLLGLRRARKPADEDYPFGHGKEVYFWSFVVAVSIFAVGAGVSLYEGILHIRHPEALGNPAINYVVLLIAIVAEGVAWRYAWRGFQRARGELGPFEAVRKGKDPTLFVVLFEDSAALLGLVVALAGVTAAQVTGNPVYDGIASVIIGAILGTVALWLAFETKGLLIGEAAHQGVRRRIAELARAQPGVEAVNEVIALHMGPSHIIATLSLDFRDELSARQVEATTAALNRAIKEAFPDVRRVFIEMEAAEAHAAQAQGA